MPNSVVSIKPDGSFDEPGCRNLAITPATKPIRISHRMFMVRLLISEEPWRNDSVPFADEPIAGRSRFHAKRLANEGYFSRYRRGPQWLQNAQSTGPALCRGQKTSAHIQEAGVPDPCKGCSHFGLAPRPGWPVQRALLGYPIFRRCPRSAKTLAGE